MASWQVLDLPDMKSLRMQPRDLRTKLTTAEVLVSILRAAQRAGQVVVFTNGCFDLLHPGHIQLLQVAKQMGALLVVGLNTDESVRRLKGHGRPILTEHERAHLLAALDCVDYVVLFGEDTPIPLLERLRPDVLVKGADYRLDQVVGRELVESYGGRVARVPVVQGLSTTEIVDRVLRNYAPVMKPSEA